MKNKFIFGLTMMLSSGKKMADNLPGQI